MMMGQLLPNTILRSHFHYSCYLLYKKPNDRINSTNHISLDLLEYMPYTGNYKVYPNGVCSHLMSRDEAYYFGVIRIE